MIRVEHVSQFVSDGFWLSKKQILKDLNFTIPERCIMGLAGPNGAGKTTLIHILVGIKRPAQGQVTLHGYPSLSRQARSKIGYLPERPYFQDFLTSEQFLNYYGTLSGLSRDELKKRIPVVLERVGLSRTLKQELRTFSKGMLQRIGIAQALLHDPEVLILDEPLSGLDPLGRDSMRRLIRELSAEGKTIFLTSHILEDLESLCTHLTVIKKGQIIVTGASQDIWSEHPAMMEVTSVNPQHELCRDDIEPESLPQTLQTMISEQRQILSIIPRRRSLEQWFE